MRFFNLGAGEIMLIMLFAVLAVGPQETARLFQQVREIVSSIQTAFKDLTSEVTRVVAEPLNEKIDSNQK